MNEINGCIYVCVDGCVRWVMIVERRWGSFFVK